MADHKVRNCAHHADAALWKRSFETVAVDNEPAHGPHHFEPAPRERSLKVILANHELRDCAHGSDAALGKRSLEAIMADLQIRDCAHRSDPAPWRRSFEYICKNTEDAHPDCVHRSDAAVWNRLAFCSQDLKTTDPNGKKVRSFVPRNRENSRRVPAYAFGSKEALSPSFPQARKP
eukprot:3008531-Amphidinium_carterae.1